MFWVALFIVGKHLSVLHFKDVMTSCYKCFIKPIVKEKEPAIRNEVRLHFMDDFSVGLI